MKLRFWNPAVHQWLVFRQFISVVEIGCYRNQDSCLWSECTSVTWLSMDVFQQFPFKEIADGSNDIWLTAFRTTYFKEMPWVILPSYAKKAPKPRFTLIFCMISSILRLRRSIYFCILVATKCGNYHREHKQYSSKFTAVGVKTINLISRTNFQRKALKQICYFEFISTSYSWTTKRLALDRWSVSKQLDISAYTIRSKSINILLEIISVVSFVDRSVNREITLFLVTFQDMVCLEDIKKSCWDWKKVENN